MIRTSVIFASTNSGKIDEFKKQISLSDNSIEVIGLGDLGYTIPECEETGKTFRENAILKVTHTRKYLHSEHRRHLVIGDDSGMSIQALNGQPGVHTRRWTGKVMSDEEIISYCLDQLRGHKDRMADYVTAYALSEPKSNAPYIIEERTRGEILESPRPESYIQGIPFRSLFYIPAVGAMFHEARELPKSKRKNLRIGHEIALDKCRSFINMNLELECLKNALAASWTSKTSYHSDQWTEDQPSIGQCAVSALLIQDVLGGDIVKCKAVTNQTQESHFFNRLLDSWDVDLTRNQFPIGTRYRYKTVTTRDEVLSHANTVKRYNELKNNFHQSLARASQD